MSSRRHTNDQQVNEKVLSITKHQENGNQSYNEISPLTSLGYFIYIYIYKSVGKNLEKLEPLYTITGM